MGLGARRASWRAVALFKVTANELSNILYALGARRVIANIWLKALADMRFEYLRHEAIDGTALLQHRATVCGGLERALQRFNLAANTAYSG